MRGQHPAVVGQAEVQGDVRRRQPDADLRRGVVQPGVAGVTIFLDTNGSGTLDPGEESTVTKANGGYLFDDVPPGVYSVREVVPAALGLLARRGDVLGIQRIVEELLDDPERLSAVTEQCRTWVVERFADGNVHDRLRALYVERGISAGMSRGSGKASAIPSTRDERSR